MSIRSIVAIAGLLFVFSNPAGAGQAPTSAVPITELRQYTLKPGQTDVLIDLFEREFIESQEAVGMKLLGQFRDLDRPDRFVWLRGYADMASRAEGLKAFYSGPVWKAHSKAANATMVDVSNVLFLHIARPDSGLGWDAAARPSKGAAPSATGLVVANIYYFDAPVGTAFVDFFEREVRPQVTAAGARVLASYVTETSPNNFPQLPIREDHAFVWFSSFADQPAYERHLAALAGSPTWRQSSAALRRRLKADPEVLRLQPTPRSQLRH